MAVVSNKILSELSKLEPLHGMNYKRWSQKLLMYFEQLEIDYVLFSDPPAAVTATSVESTPPSSNAVKSNEETIKKHDKDNKTAKFHLLTHMSNTLFDLFSVHKSAKTIWELLEKKYGADDAGKKKYVVGQWLGFQMVDDKPIMEQVHVYENLCADVTNEGMKLDEIFLANVLLEKFPPSWNEYRNHLKHKKKDLSLQELVGHMRIEEANHPKDKSMLLDGECVYMGNSSSCYHPSKGKIFLKLTSGKTLALNNVLLGHVNVDSIKKLKSMSLIPSLSSETHEKCPSCVEAKFAKKPSRPVTTRQTSLLELIHTDLTDFKNTMSRGGKHYYVTFIDDFYRYTKVYLLRNKSEAEDMFIKFKTEVENQLDRKIKRVRSDRGGEYGSGYLVDFCEKNDDMWGEAVLSTCHILNRVPHNKLDKTPYEMWKGYAPNLSYLKVWGCLAKVGLPSFKRPTIGPKTYDCVFIGYAQNSSAYRFMSLSDSLYLEARDALSF
ncbi:uncharacterized protein LOC141634910 [Silene latifolia]|uniref:uncharacterized protein LOC141634910 n=1 Tax=Silene latifolia TaxID=37657 RepID=UPI003D77CEED